MQSPPEKLCEAVAALVSVLDRVVPFIKYTSVLLATHTVCPVLEFEEQELATFGVAIRVAGAPVPIPLLVSMGTAATPVVEPPQLPSGT
jgi:hypothetical protein